jgi:hypothetical protein
MKFSSLYSLHVRLEKIVDVVIVVLAEDDTDELADVDALDVKEVENDVLGVVDCDVVAVEVKELVWLVVIVDEPVVDIDVVSVLEMEVDTDVDRDELAEVVIVDVTDELSEDDAVEVKDVVPVEEMVVVGVVVRLELALLVTVVESEEVYEVVWDVDIVDEWDVDALEECVELIDVVNVVVLVESMDVDALELAVDVKVVDCDDVCEDDAVVVTVVA